MHLITWISGHKWLAGVGFALVVACAVAFLPSLNETSYLIDDLETTQLAFDLLRYLVLFYN